MRREPSADHLLAAMVAHRRADLSGAVPLTSVRTWKCPKCAHRSPVRTSSRTCDGCGEQTKRAKPQRKHEAAKRTVSYEEWARRSVEIHGGALYACGACRKPAPEKRRQDRDHDHHTGEIRGLACGGNQGCNVLMLPWVSAATARGIYTAKHRAGEPDAMRWRLIAGYLARVEAFYGRA